MFIEWEFKDIKFILNNNNNYIVINFPINIFNTLLL